MHVPVLLKETLDLLQVRKDGTYVDVTGGGGGHAAAILEQLGPAGRLFVSDRDEEAVGRLHEKFKDEKRVIIHHASFKTIFEILKNANALPVQGILADLGVSSFQLDDPKRGFSFLAEGPLDMRADKTEATTAADVVNEWEESELADLFFRYGEERHSRLIARAITHDRQEKLFETTQDLSGLAERVLGRFYRGQKLHPATRIFQALRIAVNGELEELEELLNRLPELLAPSGRAVLISFHSLEDRIVKRKFLDWKREGFTVLTKKPLIPSDEEASENPRSRSAKLRALEKNEEGEMD